MRHLLFAVVAAAALSATAHAQQRRTAGAAPTVAPTQTAAPPTRTAPPPPSSPPQVPTAPPVLFPLPPLMTPPAGGITHPFPGFFSHDVDARDFSPSRRPRKIPPLYGSYVPGYIVQSEPEVPPEAPAGNGQLRLAVIPDRAQVFLDGYYVGTVVDIGDRGGLWLAVGPHRLEFRAIGYRTEQVDVSIEPNEALTYRGELEFKRPAAPEPTGPPASPAPPTATGSSVMYLIPNCYLGNVPPRADRLPKGCDIKRVQQIS